MNSNKRFTASLPKKRSKQKTYTVLLKSDIEFSNDLCKKSKLERAVLVSSPFGSFKDCKSINLNSFYEKQEGF